MNGFRARRACAVIRAALSNHELERQLTVSGFTPEAIADAFAIGQAEEIIVQAFGPFLETLQKPDDYHCVRKTEYEATVRTECQAWVHSEAGRQVIREAMARAILDKFDRNMGTALEVLADEPTESGFEHVEGALGWSPASALSDAERAHLERERAAKREAERRARVKSEQDAARERLMGSDRAAAVARAPGTDARVKRASHYYCTCGADSDPVYGMQHAPGCDTLK